MASVFSTSVYGTTGQVPVGFFPSSVPTKTIFQLAPIHAFQLQFLESHCCCEPESVIRSVLESARNPPLHHPYSSCRNNAPSTCTLRINVACETAHIVFVFSSMFSTPRQKLQHAL